MMLVVLGCGSGRDPATEQMIVPPPIVADPQHFSDAGRGKDSEARLPDDGFAEGGPSDNGFAEGGLADAGGLSIEPPVFTEQPMSLQVTSGMQATFSAVALRAESYQWRKNGFALPGATSSIYSIATTALGDEGTYDLVATNPKASVLSAAATLTVVPATFAPVITVQPVGVTVVAGEMAMLAARVEASPAASYQWRKDGVAIPGKNADNLTIAYALLTDGGSYDLVVSNALGQSTSAAAQLIVLVPPEPPPLFTTFPISLGSATDVEPLGNQNPSAHTLPTAHVYIYFNWSPRVGFVAASPPPILPVYAPGGGTILIVRTSSLPVGDTAIYVRTSPVLVYYLGHFIPVPGIVEGAEVQAGQQVGTTNGYGSAIDLGVINEAAPLTFANPARYSWETLYCDSPYRHFEEPLRSQIYAVVRRAGSDKDGDVQHDVAGTLAGNWFEESLPVEVSETPVGWPKQISFGPDSNDPTTVVVSIGGTLDASGKWKFGVGAPDPASVTVASGRVAYELYALELGDHGLMLVQMLGATRVEIEVFPGNTSGSADFTSAASFYVR
jgi:hypothetical protein